MNKNLTLKDLAQKLGLSISTVSRALHDNPAINDATKLRVNKLAEKLGYYPDILAKSLKNNETFTIGVIVPEISHFFFSSVIDGIEEKTNNYGYTILVTKSNEDMKREIINTKSLISNRVAGVIASISQTTNNGLHFEQILKRGIPLVLFDRVLYDLKVPKVVGNDFEKIYEIVSHLINSGYKHIGYLGGPPNLNISKTRIEGYKKALLDNNIDLMNRIILDVKLNENGGFKGARTLIQKFSNIDAICCVNDPVALGVYKYLNKVGIKIPDKIAVTGFSNNPSSKIITPSMTTVDQNGYKMGTKAAEILIKKINNKSSNRSNETHIIEGKLIIRDSSRKR